MTIRTWDYLREYQNEKEEIKAAIDKVLNSGRLVLGESVRNFEDAFSSYCGVEFGVGVNSGTDALFLGLKALGVGEGDEVITVANTAVPTVSSIIAAGAVPRFIDIDPKTYLMDTALLDAAVTEKTRCIIPVHLYGQCVDMDEVNKVASANGLKVLEDCAQCHGATNKGRKAGSLSDIAAFSFYPTKVLGGYGDGGMAITGSEEIYRKLKRLRFYGMEETYYSEEHGYNSRLDELHAEILLGKLSHLDDYVSRRREIAGTYENALKDSGLALPKTADGNEHAFHLYVSRHPERDRIISELKSRDIFVNINYPYPIHTMKAFNGLGYSEGDLPQTEKAAKEIFNLPMYPAFSDDEQSTVISEVKNILAGFK